MPNVQDQNTVSASPDTATSTPSDKLSSEQGGLAIEADKKKASEGDVIEAWGKFVSSVDSLGLESFEGEDGSKVWRLFNKNTNSTVAEAKGEDALQRLYLNAGNAGVDPGTKPSAKDAAPEHAMPGTGVKPNENMVHVDPNATDKEGNPNPGTAVANARKDAGLPISE
jgi:hypothetical protein